MDVLHFSQQFFFNAGMFTRIPRLNPYEAEYEVSCYRKKFNLLTHKHSASGQSEASAHRSQVYCRTGPEVIKLCSCSTQLSTNFILLINVKMPTIVGILKFISMINTKSEGLKARNFFTFRYFCFYEQLKCYALLS